MLTSEQWTTSVGNFNIPYGTDYADNAVAVRGNSFPVDATVDQLSTASAYPDIQYDVDGNATRFRGLTCTYDLEGQLASITSGGVAMPAGYDDDGHRIKRGQSPNTEWYAYDGDEVVFHYMPDSQTFTFYVWGPTGPIQEFTTGGGLAKTFTYDPNGNTVTRIDAQHNWELPNFYDAYGNQIMGVGTGSTTFSDGLAFRYKGQFGYWTDTDVNLIYCWHRYYDPVAARWITPDPTGLEGGVNQYAYCKGNPVSGIDPTGLINILGYEFTWETVGGGLATSAAALGHTLSFGYWDGGAYKNQPGFNVSVLFWNIALAADGVSDIAGGFSLTGSAIRFISGGISRIRTVAANIKWLEALENQGSHVIERHVGKSFSWLFNRAQGLRDGVASSFYSKNSAAKAIQEALDANKVEIQNWIAKGPKKLGKVETEGFNHILGKPAGYAVRKNGTIFRSMRNVRVVLIRRANGAVDVLTAYLEPYKN